MTSTQKIGLGQLVQDQKVLLIQLSQTTTTTTMTVVVTEFCLATEVRMVLHCQRS
jgi:hypothetical protein